MNGILIRRGNLDTKRNPVKTRDTQGKPMG
jgi:hypothetical protein